MQRSAPWSRSRLAALNAQFEPQHPRVVLDWAVRVFGPDVVQGTGFGPSGIVIMHMLAELAPGSTVFFLDTDLLFPETYALRDTLAAQLDVTIERVHGGLSLDEQAEQAGPALWERAPDRCCHLRKVVPLKRYLATKRAWITGLRRDQSKQRANTPILQWIPRYEVFKLNPLATWSRKDVWKYLFAHNLPYNALHDEGYPSIGCMPCTQAVNRDGYTREGRWQGRDKTECGLHVDPS
ncbi:phosphoadenylyl-sulfate reductase [Salisaeta longa]|uniref:phosphoadenylyl-sulfate reductase n=1 Tax=Salisaeta longa TaxID=503170 RepID=UPI0003B44DD8|nr:phosphoadenylyl-sulfate reductase [Salisaeta longa]